MNTVGLLSTLSNDLCILLTKITDAQPDVDDPLDQGQALDDLLDQVQGLGALINDTSRLLRARKEDRENDAEATPDELAAENRLYSVLCDCKIRLREMKRTFNPLQNVDGKVPTSELPDILHFDLDVDGFFKKQQDRIEWQHRTISIALQMLEFYRSRGERARLAHLVELLQECRNLPPGGPPSGPISLNNEVAEPETPSRQSGETGMPEPEYYRNDNSGASDDPIDSPISGAGEPLFGSTGAPSHEAVRSDTLMTVVKMKNPDTQIRRVREELRNSSTEDICVRDDDQWTLLHHAVLQENVPLLKLLLRKSEICDSSYLNAVNSSGHTALMEACKRARHERGSKLAHLLLEHGCEVNVVDGTKQKRSALYFIVELSANDYSISVANALLERKADVSSIYENLSHKKGYPKVNKAVEEYRRQTRGSFGDRLLGNVLR